MNPEKRLIMSGNKRIGCYWIFVLISSLPVLFRIFHYFGGWRHRVWMNVPLHSSVEAFGAAIAIAVAFILLSKARQESRGGDFPVALGFLAMGILDGLHAVSPPGEQFVFLHSLANLCGGFLFALVWLPQVRHVKLKNYYPVWLIAVAALFLGASPFIFTDFYPRMLAGGHFTATAVMINLTAGSLFLLAVVYFALQFYRHGNAEDFLFSVLALLFGLAEISFYLSGLWDAEWWFWHLLRLTAYGVVLVAMIRNYQEAGRSVLESEARFRELAENIREVFWIASVDGREILYVSPAYELVWGRSPESLYQNPDSRFENIHPEDRGRVRESFFEGAAVGLFDEEYRVLRRDGGIRWIRDRGYPVKDAAGRVVRITGIAEDITERKIAEHALRLDEDRLNALLKLSQMRNVSEDDLADYAVEEIVRLTQSRIGYLHFVNPDQRSMRLYAWSKEALKSCSAQRTPHYELEKAGVWADCVRLKRAVIHNDYQNLADKKGYPEGHSHVIRHMSAPIFDEDGKVVAIAGVGNKDTDYEETDVRQLVLFIGQLRDIFKYKRTETELRNANEKLAQLNALKSQFVAHLSHESQNPLAITKESFRQLLEGMAGEINPRQRSVLEVGERSCERLMRLVSDLLDLAKIEAGKLEMRCSEVEVVRLIEEILGTFEQRLKHKNLILEKILSSDAGLLWADPDKLSEILINLITNAVKYNLEGGRVSVSVSGDPEEVRFEVADTGAGIPEEYTKKIFDKYERVGAERIEGTGLGLPITKELVELHRGRIWVESELDKGSRFIFVLPRDFRKGAA